MRDTNKCFYSRYITVQHGTGTVPDILCHLAHELANSIPAVTAATKFQPDSAPTPTRLCCPTNNHKAICKKLSATTSTLPRRRKGLALIGCCWLLQSRCIVRHYKLHVHERIHISHPSSIFWTLAHIYRCIFPQSAIPTP